MGKWKACRNRCFCGHWFFFKKSWTYVPVVWFSYYIYIYCLLANVFLIFVFSVFCKNFCEFKCSASQWLKTIAFLDNRISIQSGALTAWLVCWAYAGQGCFRNTIPCSAESTLEIGICHFEKWKRLGCAHIPWTHWQEKCVHLVTELYLGKQVALVVSLQPLACCFLQFIHLLIHNEVDFSTCSLSHLFVDSFFQQLLRRMSICIINWFSSFSLIQGCRLEGVSCNPAQSFQQACSASAILNSRRQTEMARHLVLWKVVSLCALTSLSS